MILKEWAGVSGQLSVFSFQCELCGSFQSNEHAHDLGGKVDG